MHTVQPAIDVTSSSRGATPDRPRERRGPGTFWIDDRIIDAFAPVMRRYSFGSAALAVYVVLARRADREGHAWPSLALIAKESGSCPRTVHKTLRLLELLGLVEIAACYEADSRRQTSNLFTLLSPPAVPPEIDPDPATWPPPRRRTLILGVNRSDVVATTHPEPRAFVARHHAGAVRMTVPRMGPPGTSCTLPPSSLSPAPRKTDTPPPAPRAPLEGNTVEENTTKESNSLVVIAEAGLTGGQMWAATLDELARRGTLSRTDVETWLRPARLVGRVEGTLIVGAPNAVARDRIERRLIGPLREALTATVGRPVGVTAVVDDGQGVR